MGARVVDETVVAYLLADIVDRSNLPDGRVEDMVSFNEVSSSHNLSRLPVESEETLRVCIIFIEGSRKRYIVKLIVCRCVCLFF